MLGTIYHVSASNSHVSLSIKKRKTFFQVGTSNSTNCHRCEHGLFEAILTDFGMGYNAKDILINMKESRSRLKSCKPLTRLNCKRL